MKLRRARRLDFVSRVFAVSIFATCGDFIQKTQKIFCDQGFCVIPQKHTKKSQDFQNCF